MFDGSGHSMVFNYTQSGFQAEMYIFITSLNRETTVMVIIGLSLHN